MKNHIIKAIGCLILLPQLLTAHSSGLYVSGVAGVSIIKAVVPAKNPSLHRTGYVLAAALGYSLCNFRVEAEVAYRRHSIKQLHVHLQDVNFSQPADGNFHSVAFMVNGLYDLPFCFWVTLTVGAE